MEADVLQDVRERSVRTTVATILAGGVTMLIANIVKPEGSVKILVVATLGLVLGAAIAALLDSIASHRPLLRPPCPHCGGPVDRASTTITYRRGERSLSVERLQWRCRDHCRKTGRSVLLFADLATVRSNKERARKAWRQAFGEEMPPEKWDL